MENENLENLEKQFLEKIGNTFKIPLEREEIVHGQKTKTLVCNVPTWKQLADFEISMNMTKYFASISSIDEAEIENFSANTTSKVLTILSLFQKHFTIENKKKEELLQSCLKTSR